MIEPGHIYVLVNPSMEGWVKIGKTTRDPESRAKELSQATGVATPFYSAFSIQVADCHSAETQVYAVLEQNGFRRAPNQEFFEMPLRSAVEVLMQVEKQLQLGTYLEEQNESGEPPAASSELELEEDSSDVAHPAQALFAKACCLYYGLHDEIEDPIESLALLNRAKSMDYPAAFTAIAEYFINLGNESDVRSRPNEALGYYTRALQVLKEGAQRGHGRCHVMMAKMYRDGYASDDSRRDMENAGKCWKKYFKSPTFIADDDCKWETEGLSLSDYDAGKTRVEYAADYFREAIFFPISLDSEIRCILQPFRNEIVASVMRYIQYAERKEPSTAGCDDKFLRHQRELLKLIESSL